MNAKHTVFLISVSILCLLNFTACKCPHHTQIRELREIDISQSIICHDTVFRAPKQDLSDSLQKVNEADESWWKSGSPFNLASDYKSRLIRLLKTPQKNISAAELCAIIPANDSEWIIYYDIVEGSNFTKTFDPLKLMRDFAAADSTNVLEAYMRMGEYVDGYLAEAVFDDYIYLYHHLPKRFVQLHKLRTQRWNEGFEDWRALYDD